MLGLAAVTAGDTAALAQAEPPAVTAVDLGGPPGTSSPVAALVNDHGLVAGWGQVGPYEIRGFLWRDGVLTELPGSSRPQAVSNSGHVVGSEVHRFGTQAFRWVDGVHTPLGYLGGTDTAGGYSSSAADVNDAGEVVGSSTTDSGEQHAVRWRDGVMTDLGTLGGGYSAATAINRRGQIAGVSATADEAWHAFLWSDGVMTDLGTLGGAFAVPSDINDAGQVVGVSTTADDVTHAFLWRDGRMTDLQAHDPDGFGTAVAINRWGQVLVDSSSGLDFVWDNGWYAFLGGLGGDPTETLPRSLNDAGEVVGVSTLADGSRHAFRWIPGAMTDLGTLGGEGSGAWDVNAAGMVVGSADTPSDGAHAVFWRITDG